jgi:hypothetical protein
VNIRIGRIDWKMEKKEGRNKKHVYIHREREREREAA